MLEMMILTKKNAQKFRSTVEKTGKLTLGFFLVITGWDINLSNLMFIVIVIVITGWDFHQPLKLPMLLKLNVYETLFLILLFNRWVVMVIVTIVIIFVIIIIIDIIIILLFTRWAFIAGSWVFLNREAQRFYFPFTPFFDNSLALVCVLVLVWDQRVKKLGLAPNKTNP